MKCLIVTADDFGLTESINAGIVKALQEGIVTSVSFMPTGGAFDDALTLAEKLTISEGGAHLSLTETSPVTEPARIPTLVTKEGRFCRHYSQFFRGLFLGRIKPEDLYLELKNQLERLVKSGLELRNLSSHEYVHMMPAVLRIFIKLAKEYNIPVIRYPRRENLTGVLNPRKIYRKMILSLFERRMAHILGSSGMIAPGHFLGFLESGAITEEVLFSMLKTLREGTTELVCHPGFLSPEILDNYRFQLNAETELAALTSHRVKKRIEDSGIKLITYREFLKEY